MVSLKSYGNRKDAEGVSKNIGVTIYAIGLDSAV